jgi:hypothetical protein
MQAFGPGECYQRHWSGRPYSGPSMPFQTAHAQGHPPGHAGLWLSMTVGLECSCLESSGICFFDLRGFRGVLLR